MGGHNADGIFHRNALRVRFNAAHEIVFCFLDRGQPCRAAKRAGIFRGVAIAPVISGGSEESAIRVEDREIGTHPAQRAEHVPLDVPRAAILGRLQVTRVCLVPECLKCAARHTGALHSDEYKHSPLWLAGNPLVGGHHRFAQLANRRGLVRGR
jgi:hypothetical protein